ncbi:hypothetical protein N8592_01855 [Verrucomicrobia bacterium]|nr:hypothetical protein [Verrucomicrobiota bacterium]
MKTDISELKKLCPLPQLMAHLGLADYAKSSCRSPFREDKHASFGVFQSNGMWFYKDHATGESGDEINFLANYYGLNQVSDFSSIIHRYEEIVGASITETHWTSNPPQSRNKKQRGVVGLGQFHKGTSAEIWELARAGPYNREGLLGAADRGCLLFGTLFNYQVYVLTDSAKRLAEARRVDGGLFARGNKVHTLRGSDKRWPLGIIESQPYSCIAVMEGGPDFLQAHYDILWEQASDRLKTDVACAPVCMLGASNRISEDALRYFEGKMVRIFPHNDEAGLKAGEIWAKQIARHRPESIDFFDMSGATQEDNQPISDFYDCRNLSKFSFQKDEALWLRRFPDGRN